MVTHGGFYPTASNYIQHTDVICCSNLCHFKGSMEVFHWVNSICLYFWPWGRESSRYQRYQVCHTIEALKPGKHPVTYKSYS